MLSLLGLDLLLVASLIFVLRMPDLRRRVGLRLIVIGVAILGAAIMIVAFILALYNIDPTRDMPVEARLPLSLAIGLLMLGLFAWLYIAVRRQELHNSNGQ
jgi:uncharacterized BrkB/YihY/UPF0761 family membrane protein